MTKRQFLKKWISANTLGFLIGFLLYTPIGHAITGQHNRDLTTGQLIAHTVALAVVGFILFLFQRKVLKRFFSVSHLKIILATLVFVGLFWFGYYQNIIPGELDYDILFGFLVLGTALWITSVSFIKHKFRWMVAVISFPLASFVAEVILFAVYLGFQLDIMAVQTDTLQHMIFWVVIGLITGLLGGWISGLALYKMLSSK